MVRCTREHLRRQTITYIPVSFTCISGTKARVIIMNLKFIQVGEEKLNDGHEASEHMQALPVLTRWRGHIARAVTRGIGDEPPCMKLSR